MAVSGLSEPPAEAYRTLIDDDLDVTVGAAVALNVRLSRTALVRRWRRPNPTGTSRRILEVKRESERRGQDWKRSYLTTVLARDLTES